MGNLLRAPGSAATALLVTLLASCGGGGGGNPSGTTDVPDVPSQGPVLAVDAAVYFPATSPVKHFRGKDSRVSALWPEAGYANIETWTGNAAARTLNETNPLNDGAGNTVSTTNVQLSIASDGVHDLSGRWVATDVLILRSPVRQDDQYTPVNKSVSIPDVDGDGQDDSIHVALTVHVVGNEAVSVAAGSFSAALKVVTSTTLTATGTKVGVLPPISIVSTDWYAKSIGRVKSNYVDGTSPAGYLGNVVAEELAGYRDSVNAFGYMASTPLFADRKLDPAKAPVAVESGGSGYLVALSQGTAVFSKSFEGGGSVVGTLMGNDGHAGATLTLFESAMHGGYSPAVVSRDTGYLVVSGDKTRLLAQRVTADGTVLDGRSGAVIYSSGQLVSVPSMTRLGNRILLAWSEGTGNADASMFSRAMLLDASTGQPMSQPVTITSPTGFAGYPRVAASQNGFLLVFSGWTDSFNYFLARAYPATLYASRIDANGQLLDAQPVALSDAGTAHSVADVRFDGTDYLVTWADNRNHLQAANRGVYPPEDAYTGTFMQDIFMTRLSPDTGAVGQGLAPTGTSATSIAAYRDSPGLAIETNQVVEAHNVFGSSAASGVYFRWLDAGLSPTAAAILPDNMYALDTLPTFTSPWATYGLSQIAGNSQSALVVFAGTASSNQCTVLCASLILPRISQ